MQSLEDLNFKARCKFIDIIRDNFVWSGLVPIIVLASSNMFIGILTEHALKGIVTYVIILLLSYALFCAIHIKLFGTTLEEEYQWGNSEFEDIEGNLMDKLYIKGKIDGETFDDYFIENDRASSEEDYAESQWYFSRGKMIKWICSLVISLVSCVPAILALP
ncbi:hypothetical protein UT300012_21310 [Paraclostridium bifermentans]